MLAALALIVDTTAFRLKANVFDTPAEFAVRVTFCAVPTAVTAAENDALVAPAGTSTLAGTTTYVLLLETLTLIPALGAAAVSETAHTSVVKPLTDALEQESELKAALAAPVVEPVKPTLTELPADELLETLRTPVALPDTVGLNFTVRVRDEPGLSFAGKVPPDTENPAPCTAAE
jgi:hypothetical protein